MQSSVNIANDHILKSQLYNSTPFSTPTQTDYVHLFIVNMPCSDSCFNFLKIKSTFRMLIKEQFRSAIVIYLLRSF